MNIEKIRQTNLGGVSRSHDLTRVTLITGTNMSGKSNTLRVVELGLTNSLTDPENPTESKKQNAEIFKLTTDGFNEMATDILFDDSRIVERRYVRKEDKEGKPTISYIPSFTGQSIESIGAAKATDAELAQWLRPDQAGINIQYLPGLTEMKRRELLIQMIAGMPSGEDVEEGVKRDLLLERYTSNDGTDGRLKKLMVDLGCENCDEVLEHGDIDTIYAVLMLSDRVFNYITQHNQVAPDDEQPLSEMIDRLVIEVGGFGSTLDRLRRLELIVKGQKKETDKELKHVEGTQKKLTEDEVTDTEPADIDELETELEKVNKLIPELTEQKGASDTAIKQRDSLHEQLRKLPPETIACPGKWAHNKGFDGCAFTEEKVPGDAKCEQCGGTAVAQVKYIQGKIDELPNAEATTKQAAHDKCEAACDGDSKTAQDAIDELNEKLKGIDIIEEVQQATKKHDDEIAELDQELNNASKARDKAADEKEDFRAKIGGAETLGKEADRNIVILHEVPEGESGSCPICGGMINPVEIIARFNKKLEETNEALVGYRKEHIKSTEKWSEQFDLVVKLTEKLHEARTSKTAELQQIENDKDAQERIINGELQLKEGQLAVSVSEHKTARELTLTTIKGDYAGYKKDMDHFLMDVENAGSVTDTRVSLEQELAGLEIGDLDKIATRITQQTARQKELNELIGRSRDAAKVAEQMAKFNEDAERLRVQLALIKLIVASVGTKGLQGEIFKDEAGPFNLMVNEIMELITPGKEFVINYYDPRGKEACVFGFREGGEYWTWETASRGERNMACIAVAIARMRLNTKSTIKVLLFDNLDMMDIVYTQYLNEVIELCLVAVERNWVDNVLLAGIVDIGNLTAAIMDNDDFSVIEFTERITKAAI